MACPSGYKLVNGKCTDANGNTISAPYVSNSGKFFPTNESLTSGCNKNPNSPECKKIISNMSPEQRTKMKMGGAKKPKMMSGGTKPKAMYGTSMKPGMMKKGGTKKK